MKKKNFTFKYHYLIIPLLITISSFFVYQSCQDFLCVFGGRGYPIPFYNDWFVFWFFLADLVIWWVVYMIVFIIFKIIKNPRIFTK